MQEGHLKALGSINWKRWAATLCVALVAFVMVERATCIDVCDAQASAGSYSVASAPLAAAPDGSEHSDTSGVSTSHHCSAAHCAAMPVPEVTGQVRAPLSSHGMSLASAGAPDTMQGGPERPPREIVTA